MICIVRQCAVYFIRDSADYIIRQTAVCCQYYTSQLQTMQVDSLLFFDIYSKLCICKRQTQTCLPFAAVLKLVFQRKTVLAPMDGKKLP